MLLAYPYIVSVQDAAESPSCTLLSPAEQLELRAGQDDLTAMLEEVASVHPRVLFVDPREHFAGYESCSGDPQWVNDIVGQDTMGSRPSVLPSKRPRPVRVPRPVGRRVGVGGAQVIAARSEWVRALGTAVLLVPVASGCVGEAGRGVDWREIADDRALVLQLDGARPQEIDGRTGAGESAEGLDDAYSAAWRRWSVEGDALTPALAEAITELRGLPVHLRTLTCRRGSVAVFGQKTGTVEGRDVLVDVSLGGWDEPSRGWDEASAASGSAVVEVRLSTDGQAGPQQATADDDDPPGGRIRGDCPDIVVQAFSPRR